MSHPTAERDPDAWAIYVRADDLDGAQIMRSVQLLGDLVGRRGGRVAGIYADVADQGGPELAVLLGHGTLNKFANVALVDVTAIGTRLDHVAHVVMGLFDVGVRLYVRRYADQVVPDGMRLDLHQVGRDVLGAVAGDRAEHYGRTIDVITNRVGTAPGRRRGPDTD